MENNQEKNVQSNLKDCNCIYPLMPSIEDLKNSGIKEENKYYVYRLVDPRNGNTFYVGKGEGNRVLDHVTTSLLKVDDLDNDIKKYELDIENPDDNIELLLKDKYKEKIKELSKSNIIEEIKKAGLCVIIIIHRHGLNSNEALLVEATLIDVYNNLTNKQLGKYSSVYGVRNLKEYCEFHTAADLKFNSSDSYLIIKINDYDSTNGKSIEEALFNRMKGDWRAKKQNANKADYIVVVLKGLVVLIYENPKNWDNSKSIYNKPRIELLTEFDPTNVKNNAPNFSDIYKRRLPNETKYKGRNPIAYVNIP